MADVTRFWIFLVLSTICVSAGVLTGKAYYCRDPDTGKLHAVNSTWPSKSFCGNYTCKLKRINITEMEYVPLRQINVTNIDKAAESNDVSIEKKSESNMRPILHKDILSDQPTLQNTKTDTGDRYLTETEIKTISEVLHTVKKSDLDAIVDLYNIAQDIYKEIDKTTTDSVTDKSMNTVRDVNSQYDTGVVDNKHISYWYEPINNNIIKAQPEDMEIQGSNIAQTTLKPTSEPRPLYFNGAVNNNDFGKLPYYYPISPFQRTSSYVHQPQAVTKPCNQAMDHAIINQVLKKPYQEQRLIQPSMLLPYPFSYVHHYNNTGYLNNYYYGRSPWTQFEFYNNRNYPYAYTQIPNNAVFMNPPMKYDAQSAERNSVSKEEKNILNTLISKAKESKLPDWQTPPLPAHVLEEVRANIENTNLLKPFSLRKKVNLERVGKLIKLDEFVRSKRDAEAIAISDKSYEENLESGGDYYDVYDVQLETITCQSDIKPGYFRMGNLTRPYPDCCPQRIDKPIDKPLID